MNGALRRVARQVVLWSAGALLAPAALAQVPQQPCGTPPAPVAAQIPFVDITTQTGYQSLAAPTTDTMSDYIGGTGGADCYYFYCYSPSAENDINGPFTQTFNLATLNLPFPFGFSGIYSDGGAFIPPFQVNVWANGLLTFDPSISFDPYKFPLTTLPSDCEWEGCNEIVNPCCTCEPYPTDPTAANEGAVSDTFGGFPFVRTYAPPNALVAPWWGDLSVCPNFGQVGWLLTLDENNQPMAIIQWTNVTATKAEVIQAECAGLGDWSSCEDQNFNPYEPGGTLPQFSFQVRLHQNNDIDFVYGPSSHLNSTGDCFQQAVGSCGYISGIQSNLIFPDGVRPALLDYSTQALDCSSTTGCLQPQFPSGTSVTFKDIFRSVGPDLQVVAIDPPGQVPQGGTITFPATISNGGGTDSSGEGQLQFYFSAGGTTPEGSPFSNQPVTVYHACSTAPFPAQVTIPAQAPQGGGYLIAEFIPGAESVDQNHSFAYAPVIVGPPEPDLATVGPLVYSPAAVIGGQQMTVSFEAQNVGEVDAAATAYGIYVSLGGSISTTGIQIGGGTLTALPAGQSENVTTTVTVPLTLVSGDYFIGVILNPGDTLKEVNLSNNVALGAKLVEVTSPGPVITTTSLLDAVNSAPYSVQLLSGGGDGKYQWSLAGGALPAGLALTKAGVIDGQAEAVGSSAFTVKVTDGLGHSATKALTLGVDPFDQALTIETQSLPAGSTAQQYNFTIAAVGGVPPYQWSLVPQSGQLPAGISLVGNGALTGQPLYDGATSFQVSVTDSKGAKATSGLLTLTVYAAGTLAVGSTVLPPATFNTTYTTTLHYAGGSGPYIWTLVDVFREPSAPGDPGADLGSTLPSALGWFPEQGEIEGVPMEVGVFALTVQVTDSESPPATAEGLVLLTISSSASFSFQTVQLPAATTNQFYTTQLVTSAPATDTVTFQVLNTSLKPSDTAKQTLPPGLTLYSSGQIQGVPLEQGEFAFTVGAVDSQGGNATQSFAILVANAPPPASSGCQSAGGTPALAGLLLLALTQTRRVSRRRRGAGSP